MTRIVGGTLKGRRLVLPADARVRPTSDRVREAWFSIVAPELPGARVVDLYAGSGALGLEALSRGAAHATFVDILPAALAAIRANVAALDLGARARVVRRPVPAFLDRVEPLAFDVAFADPPYAHDAAARLAERFRTRPFARVLGIEHPRTTTLAGDLTRRYGDTTLTFFHGL